MAPHRLAMLLTLLAALAIAHGAGPGEPVPKADLKRASKAVPKAAPKEEPKAVNKAALKAEPKAETSEKAASKKLRVLSIMTFDAMSHHLWMASLTVRLAERGHYVHSVDIAVPKNAPPNLNVTVIDRVFRLQPTKENMKRLVEGNGFEKLKFMAEIGERECKHSLSTAALKQLIDSSFEGQFDLLLIDYGYADCYLGFAHRFNYPPTVLLTPYPGGAHWVDTAMGNPAVPAIMPMMSTPFQSSPTLWERIFNVALHVYDNYHKETVLEPAITQILREAFEPAMPTSSELRKHVSLALVNEVPVLEPARPLTPSIIPVGGMHTKPADLTNIPSDLKTWMDSAPDGFIFMSFGSIMKGSYMDADKRKAVLQAFASLKERILWKFETDDIRKDLPPNVRIEKWLPQNDILGHPNIRLFISHCGGLSTQEATYQGVPVLGVPHMVDQFLNVEKLENLGMGIRMSVSEIAEGRLLPKIREMLGNSSYREKAQQVSRLLQDQKEHPLDRAVWWVEYVARHRGAPHLRSPALALRWYQVLLLDVQAVLVLAAVAALLLPWLSLRLALCCLRRFRTPKTKTVKRD